MIGGGWWFFTVMRFVALGCMWAVGCGQAEFRESVAGSLEKRALL